MPSVAEQLRQAREQQKLSVHQVADITKIKTDHVRALEQGDYGVFAAPIYVRGFVRTYATVLRLDVPRVMEQLEAELGETERFRESSSPERKRTILDMLSLLVARANWRLLLPLVIGAALITAGIWIYRAWDRHRSADPLRNLGPGLYQPPSSNTGDVLPLPAPAVPANG